MYNPYSLEGKTILITGASSGIGRATAVECSKLGATLVLSGRNEDRIRETLAMCDNPNKHSFLLVDISNEEGVRQLVSDLPLIDGCVSNAGVGKTVPISFISEDKLKDLFRIDCFSSILLTKELVKKKKLAKKSSVVYTLSIAGNYNILPGNSIYGTAKTGLSAFVKYAAVELASKGIRCNAVSPGMVNTPLVKSTRVSEEDLKNDMEQYPLKRYGEPEEIAYAIIYLLSDAASWVTGSNLVIDGGRSLK